MTEEWHPEEYRDTYYDDVMALVEKKIHANQTKTVTEPETGEAPRRTAKVVDLMDLLKKSIEQKGKKPAKGARAEETEEEEEAPAPRKKAAKAPAKPAKTATAKAKPSARPGTKTPARAGRSAAR